MVEGKEIVMFMLGLGVILFIVVRYRNIIGIPDRVFLIASFVVFTAAAFFSIIESFFLENVINIFEHLCYTVSAVLLLVWCVRTARLFKWKQS